GAAGIGGRTAAAGAGRGAAAAARTVQSAAGADTARGIARQGAGGVIDDLGGILYSVSVMLVPAIIAITFHEAAHGFVAWRLGVDPALRQGRLTSNLLSHLVGFGTLILPAILLLLRAPFIFGYAKPVPVNFARLHNPRRDMVWVALAGPGTNLLLA